MIQVPIKKTPEDKKKFAEYQRIVTAVLNETQKDGVVEEIMAQYNKQSEAAGPEYEGNREKRIKELCVKAGVNYHEYLEALGHSNSSGVSMAIGVQTDCSTPALANFGSEKLKLNC